MWKSLEDLVEEVFADREGGIYIAEIQRSRIEATVRVVVGDELHVISSDLLWCCG